MGKMFSIEDVVRELGVEPDNKLMWGVGIAVAHKWRKQRGGPSPAERRPKRSRQGAQHFLSVYPPDFKPTIIEAILNHGATRKRQGDLFDD